MKTTVPTLPMKAEAIMCPYETEPSHPLTKASVAANFNLKGVMCRFTSRLAVGYIVCSYPLVEQIHCENNADRY